MVEPAIADSEAGPLKFEARDGFRHELRRRVDHYFASTGRRPRDCWQMYAKSLIVVGCCAASYAVLVFGGPAWWLAVPLAILLGLSLAGAGFNIQHDGGHGAYSNHRWINKLASMMLDLLGGSSYVWARKHNKIHHSFTNITGDDDDINVGLLGRLSPHQTRLKFHRVQHFYMWGLYGLLPTKWYLYDDFRDIITGRIGGHRFPRPKARELMIFIGGKAVFFALAIGLPLLLHPWWSVLALYGIASFVEGVTLSVVFQMAHCVEGAQFPLPRQGTRRMESSWAAHQVVTTMDFAPRSRVLSWLVGGLNFQIEHHLFPQICHIHYRALAPVIEQACIDYGLAYRAHKSFLIGLWSHFRWLRQMGLPVIARDRPAIQGA